MKYFSLPVRLTVEICSELKPVPLGNTLRTYRSKSLAGVVEGSTYVIRPPAQKLFCETIATVSARIAPDVTSTVPETSTIDDVVRFAIVSPFSHSVWTVTFTVNVWPCGPCTVNEFVAVDVTPAT